MEFLFILLFFTLYISIACEYHRRRWRVLYRRKRNRRKGMKMKRMVNIRLFRQ